MKTKNLISRRTALKGSILGLLSTSIPFIAKSSIATDQQLTSIRKPHIGYPAISDEVVREVVGKSHFDLDRVKELVDQRPELARSTWDWGFGDFESALGAASHVGRRDIVDYLLSKGATPNLFTYAVMGAHDIVKGMIEFTPGIQKIYGPHGISLLSHAKAALRMEDKMSASNVESAKKLIAYLEGLGDADGEQYDVVEESEMPKYLGDYKYGPGDLEGFSVKVNMRKLLSLGTIGAFGGSLYKIGDNRFLYNGAPSTEVSFQVAQGKVVSLTVREPGSELVAMKV